MDGRRFQLLILELSTHDESCGYVCIDEGGDQAFSNKKMGENFKILLKEDKPLGLNYSTFFEEV